MLILLLLPQEEAVGPKHLLAVLLLDSFLQWQAAPEAPLEALLQPKVFHLRLIRLCRLEAAAALIAPLKQA